MTPGALIRPAGLLHPHFAGPSWDRWRAVVSAAYGEPLDRKQEVLFREVAERNPPSVPVRELWAVVGRRGGKDSMASAIAIAAACGDYADQLRPGERATVLCLASNREQAKIVHRYIRGYFAKHGLLAALVTRETDESLELSNMTEIVVSTNSFRAVRGRSIVCAILDECAFYRSEESANPDAETYAALLPAMSTFKAPILIGISSPYRRAGSLFEKWREAYGKNDPDVLVVRGASKLFNPTLPDRVIEREMERDPERAASEYLAEWRSDLSDFVDRGVVEAAVQPGRHELPPVSTNQYHAFVDPSGGSSDSTTLAISHRENEGLCLT